MTDEKETKQEVKKEVKKKEYVVGQVVTQTAPAILDKEDKEVTAEAALVEILNEVKEIKNLIK